ncbi:ImmA/IrrE family metallo-endopeptidase [Parafrankia sp. FMc6]|uniref:ImmA/IrrE family metallo-endopeptidase n=1 Tax=Parafrankia soli TaxID=2599596 RepID=UPI0034D60A67
MKTANIIDKVREIIPARSITQGEALILAERQATLLLQLLAVQAVPVDVFQVSSLPGIEVRVKPRHEMPAVAELPQTSEVGGVTHLRRDGSWLLTINREDAIGRRRFSLAHEFKHVLDHPVAERAYAKLGYGNGEYRARQIERICDHFAACFLMPRTALKRAWSSGIQDLEALAGQFNVSLTAMRIRLDYLGLTNEADRPVSEYFRLTARPRTGIAECPGLAA